MIETRSLKNTAISTDYNLSFLYKNKGKQYLSQFTKRFLFQRSSLKPSENTLDK